MTAKPKYDEIAADLKWAIRAVAAARCQFLTQAYISRLTDVENELISVRNETLAMVRGERTR